MNQISAFVLSYNELNKLVTKLLPNNSEKFECISCFEFNNYEEHLVTNVGSNWNNSYFQEHVLPELEKYFETGKYKMYGFDLPDLLEYLVRVGSLVGGNYIVKVSW